MMKARFHVSTKLTFRGATSIGERWEDKFRLLANLSFNIEYKPVPFRAMIRRLVACAHRRRLRSVSERVAETCHVSKRESVSEVIYLLKFMYKEDSEMAQDLSYWLEFDEKESDWLSS
jgi:hypothetical protein